MAQHLSRLTFLLVAVSGLNGLIRLPLFMNKIQLFEPIFLVAFIILVAYSFKKQASEDTFNRWIVFLNPIDKALLVFMGLTLLNLTTHPSRSVFMECIGNAYVLTIYFFFSRTTYLIHPLSNLPKAWRLMGVFTFLACVFSLIWYHQTGSERYVTVYPDSAYFGTIVRPKGFSSSSNAAASVLVFSFFLGKMDLNGAKRLLFCVFILLAGALTQSKEIIFLVGLLLLFGLLYTLKSRVSPVLFKVIGITGYFLWTIVCVVMTLWIISFSDLGAESKHFFIGNLPIFYQPTGYFYLFDVAIRTIQEAPILGIGLGNFFDKVQYYKDLGVYPTSLATFEAHDLYWGMLAQLGIGYIVFLVIFIHALQKTIRQLWQKGLSNEAITFGCCLLFVGIDAFSDVGAIHFRHYWILLGIVSGLAACITHKKQVDILLNVNNT